MEGHVGLGVKAAKEVATAIRGAIIAAKMTIIPVRRGYWGNKVGAPHTVPVKITAKCGSVRMRLIPAPKGTGIVAANVPKKVLEFAGIEGCYTSSRGSTKTLGNFVKATFFCIRKLLAISRLTSGRRPASCRLRTRSSPTTSRAPQRFKQCADGDLKGSNTHL